MLFTVIENRYFILHSIQASLESIIELNGSLINLSKNSSLSLCFFCFALDTPLRTLFSQIYCYVLLINIFNLLKLLQLEEFALLRDCIKRRIYLDCFDFCLYI